MIIKSNCYSYILVLLLAVFIGSINTQASENDEKAVKQAVSQFYVALNEMFKGNIEPMKEVWSHACDVIYMGPRGSIKVGWDRVLADWEAQAAMNLGGTVLPDNMIITVGKDIAVATNYEKGSNVDSEGKPIEVSIRATNTFHKEDGKWKMIGHHTDLLPFLQK